MLGRILSSRNLRRSLTTAALLLVCLAARGLAQENAGIVSGELKRWHRVTVTFDGPETGEAAQPNPFTDYRLTVTFSKGSRRLVVPGYYAADGDAANSGSASGNKWRVHFVPDQEGRWEYTASFRAAPNIAVSLDPGAGKAAWFDGASGTLDIGQSDKQAPDFRSEGMLQYVGGHHLRFAQSGRYYLKSGADSPENFLGYADFDQTTKTGGSSVLHRFEPHVKHWKAGDPTWRNGKGKGIIGALNYLSSMGVNSVYFLTYNLDGGDGQDTWMWTSPRERLRFDCSKLDQWEIVFSHMDRLGIALHVVTQETENDRRLGGSGELNDVRKLYYRELAARFSHHLALIWNLGEENNNSDPQRKAFARYIRALDPYRHPVTVHTHMNRASTFYNGLLGDPDFEASSIQGAAAQYNAWAIELRRRSAQAGRKWAIYGDEQAPCVDKRMNNLDQLRKEALWGNLMGGGAGVEWYFGYQGDFGDLQTEDWTAARPLWEYTRNALEFFHRHLPFAEMQPANELTTAANDYCLAKPGDTYAVYLPAGGTTQIKLPPGRYTVKWYDPRAGGPLLDGSVTAIEAVEGGAAAATIGNPPRQDGQDWAALIVRQN